MKDPVDHILRPRLPWRDDQGAVTECGLDASKIVALTREQFFERLKDLGRQRTAMLTCMTCSETTRRWRTWEEDPRQAIDREINWECGNGYYQPRDDRGFRLKDELNAMAALVEAHRKEFAGLVTAIGQRREWLKRKADFDRKDRRP